SRDRTRQLASGPPRVRRRQPARQPASSVSVHALSELTADRTLAACRSRQPAVGAPTRSEAVAMPSQRSPRTPHPPSSAPPPPPASAAIESKTASQRKRRCSRPEYRPPWTRVIRDGRDTLARSRCRRLPVLGRRRLDNRRRRLYVLMVLGCLQLQVHRLDAR